LGEAEFICYIGHYFAYCTSPGYWMMMMMMMSVEQPVERLTGGVEVLGENLSMFRFVSHKSHMT
jgi:hypothetical protein